ncbi:MAG: hypothetical protein ABIU11_05195 [Chitinophagaceae bacterium]
MKINNYSPFTFSLVLILGCFSINSSAQMITGVWKGKINKQKVEVKIIQNGDSLTGTSYYYESANNYRRYSIKGYFDQNSNSAVWWDDQLLDEKSYRFNISIPGKIPMLSRADFNCPGGGKMMLDGKASNKEQDKPTGDVDLDKISTTQFEDEWDFVIDNYTVGSNNPDIIDSIDHITQQKTITQEAEKTFETEKPVAIITQPKEKPIEKPVQKIKPPTQEPKPIVKITEPLKPSTIEQKFITRTKTFIKEIPLSGDSVELRFYDNAEIDGDSISLFLNNKLIFSHIRLTGNAYSIKIAVSEMNQINELIMVAENMGTIPPNTSYMVAIVNNQRYDAYLASTEGSSAMVRFVKQE